MEGNSIRGICRITGVSKNTVAKLLVDVGYACQCFHDEKVVDVKTRRVECDEAWSFVYAKQKNAEKTGNPEAGDAWIWVALDADSRLVVSWLVGKRDTESANMFMHDVAARLKNMVQLTTDGLKTYLDAIENAFEGIIDYAQLDKQYGISEKDGKIDNRIKYIGAKRTRICGNPNPKLISTSYVERQNLTLRMHGRRFMRKTNGFSKKLENHGYAVAIHYVYYNFVKIHQTLRVTPAMEAGVTNRLMEITDMVKLTENYSKNSN